MGAHDIVDAARDRCGLAASQRDDVRRPSQALARAIDMKLTTAPCD
jgi:hypothetical protein